MPIGPWVPVGHSLPHPGGCCCGCRSLGLEVEGVLLLLLMGMLPHQLFLTDLGLLCPTLFLTLREDLAFRFMAVLVHVAELAPRHVASIHSPMLASRSTASSAKVHHFFFPEALRVFADVPTFDRGNLDAVGVFRFVVTRHAVEVLPFRSGAPTQPANPRTHVHWHRAGPPGHVTGACRHESPRWRARSKILIWVWVPRRTIVVGFLPIVSSGFVLIAVVLWVFFVAGVLFGGSLLLLRLLSGEFGAFFRRRFFFRISVLG
mmetsp:Transcript_39168/g.83402  ORF Transcript_39168/g.83402 Transcript_39168/m.83402 type:complete len:261 (-) Transcript_39168:1057-1839(-)